MSVSVRREGVSHPARALSTDARALLKHLRLSRCELSILLCDDPFIQDLNVQWRQKDEPTDVLSFAMNEGESVGDDSVLGDIVISLDMAGRQASVIGHALELELRVLLVHGLCHLLGYDHIDPDDAVEMQAIEGELLAVLGGGVGLVGR